MEFPRFWLTWFCVCLGCMAGPLRAADFHVAPGGSDSNPGTRARPFATLEAAREAVRSLRGTKGIPARGVTVWLHGGDHPRKAALELGPLDSGRPGSPVTWRAWRSDTVRLLGGVSLPMEGGRAIGWHAVTDPDVVSRLPEEARRHVREMDVGALGVTGLGGLQSRGFSRPTVAAHSELFHGGRPMTLARWPNAGAHEKIAGFPQASGKGDDHGGSVGDLPGGFLYEGDRPVRWKDRSELWVHGYWAWDWANSYEKVAELDPARRWIRTEAPHGLYGFRKGQRFFYLNVLEELDQPGEWYLDRKKGRLYFWPPGPAGQETLLSVLEQPLIRFNGASNVVVRGLVLEATRGNAIEIRGGAGVLVAGCTLRNIGNNAVVIEGGQGHGVAGCEVIDTGDGGVTMSGGDRQTLAAGGHFVEDCHFRRQGRWSKCYVPAIHMQGVGLRASHNHIEEHPHCAILFWGNDHLIEFNDIHHIALETGDVGAIYTGRDYSFRGNRIRHNYIHETGGVGMGSMGVYMDDCVSGTEVYCNVFYKVHWAMFIGGGSDHRVENNLFVDCDPAIRADARGMDRSPVWRGMVDDFMRKQLAAVPGELYRRRYPELRAVDRYFEGEFKGVPAENNVIVRNVCVGKWLELGWHAKPEGFEVRDNFVGADPGWADAGRKGYRLKRDAPALKAGFKPIPFERIGVRPAGGRGRR